MTAAECAARHHGVDTQLGELRQDSKKLFWLQLTNLAGVIAVLAGLIAAIIGGVLVYILTL